MNPAATDDLRAIARNAEHHRKAMRLRDDIAGILRIDAEIYGTLTPVHVTAVTMALADQIKRLPYDAREDALRTLETAVRYHADRVGGEG